LYSIGVYVWSDTAILSKALPGSKSDVTESRNVPIHIENLDSKGITKICCGINHSAVISSLLYVNMNR